MFPRIDCRKVIWKIENQRIKSTNKARKQRIEIFFKVFCEEITHNLFKKLYFFENDVSAIVNVFINARLGAFLYNKIATIFFQML